MIGRVEFLTVANRRLLVEPRITDSLKKNFEQKRLQATLKRAISKPRWMPTSFSIACPRQAHEYKYLIGEIM